MKRWERRRVALWAGLLGLLLGCVLGGRWATWGGGAVAHRPGVRDAALQRELAVRWWRGRGSGRHTRPLWKIPVLAVDKALYADSVGDGDGADEEPWAYCNRVPLYLDVAEVTRRAVVAAAHPKPPFVSVVYVTKRPGGYDMLLNSLAQQARRSPADYELICVDEAAPFRVEKVREEARRLGVNLVAMVPSKPRQPRYRDLRFGIYNALNTGFLLSRGQVIMVVMDFTWIPPNAIARTIEFYRQPEHERSLLAYPERFVVPKELNDTYVARPGSLTVFHEPMTASPGEYLPGGRMVNRSRIGPVVHTYMRPAPLVRAHLAGHPHGYEKQSDGIFWELSFAALPWRLLEDVHGAEEFLDRGDDCHEINLRLRGEQLGYDTYIDGQTLAQKIWHHDFGQDYTWTRFANDSNVDFYFWGEIDRLRKRKRPARAVDAQVDWRRWRQLDCPLQAAYGMARRR